jgi:hypothetical protein
MRCGRTWRRAADVEAVEADGGGEVAPGLAFGRAVDEQGQADDAGDRGDPAVTRCRNIGATASGPLKSW